MAGKVAQTGLDGLGGLAGLSRLAGLAGLVYLGACLFVCMFVLTVSRNILPTRRSWKI